MELKDIIQLAKATAKSTSSAPVAFSYGDKKYSYEDLNDTLRTELNKIAGTYQLFRDNKNKLFTIMEETINDVLPAKVLEQYGQFAEVKHFAQGDGGPVFYQRVTQASRRRAKSFVTKVGLAGVYEVAKLDGRSYTVPTSAFGGAIQIGFEEFLDGRVDWGEMLSIMMEGLDEAIYMEIERALKAAVVNLQPANKTVQTSFVENEMDRLISIVDSYGTATIYCTYEFAATMIPSDGWVAYSDAMKQRRWDNGYFATYHGHNVVVMRQSYEDETNMKKVMDPAFAWIIPSGAGEKPVKIAFEGSAQVREWENHDWSRDLHLYEKVGVGALLQNNVCVYINSSLTR